MKSFNLTLCALLAMVVALPAMAAPTGTIYANGGKASGTLRWMNSAKKYTITNAKGMTTEYKEDDVENVDVDRPKELDAAIKQVKAGSAASAVANLEKIAKEYTHLTYDREATEWLAKAYLAQGNAAKAVAACEAIIRNDDEAAYMGPMAVAYWKALTKDGKASKLGLLLDKAIASGDAAAAAAALVARGNAAMERGSNRTNCEEALRDGYLRVILLYADPASEAYAEALYMGAKAFDGMGQGNRANKLREDLKANCSGSEWARK